MILIVDDQKYIGAGLERLLRYAGYDAVSVTGGAEAIAMLKSRKTALIVLDLDMPEMDGLSVLRTVRANKDFKDVTITMYSTEARAETIAEAKRLGAADFIVKGSLDFDTLIARLSKLAGGRP